MNVAVGKLKRMQSLNGISQALTKLKASFKVGLRSEPLLQSRALYPISYQQQVLAAKPEVNDAW